MLPFYGKAHIAYIPNGHVVGLSKLARLVECFARRMQIQEKLMQQIADAMVEHTGARGVGVMIEAQHMCMVARGVQKQNSVMVTSAIRGVFKDDPGVRDEFLRLGGHR
jgi:GTP cyclohydrolase I